MTIGHLNANDVTQKLCGRYHQLVDRNGICVSQMAVDLFSFIYCFLSSFNHLDAFAIPHHLFILGL
jgi:hypothetical protein